MEKRLLSVPFTILLFAGITMAQPTLQQSGMLPFGSKVTINIADNAGNIDTTLQGANKVWNFNNIPATSGSTLVYTLKAPSQTPNGSSFPAANYCREEVEGGVTAYRYFNLTSTKMERVGSYISSVNTYSDPQIEYVFPTTLGTSSNDTWDDTNSSFGGGTYDFKCVGTGSLTTPGGTFPNTLMVRIHLNELVDLTTYIWYNADNGSELLTYLVGDGFFYNDEISYLVSVQNVATSVLASQDFNKQISFKNPVENEMHINFLKYQVTDYSYVITTVMGEKMNSGKMSSSGLIDCNQLPEGMYLVAFKDEEGNQSTPVKFIKSR